MATIDITESVEVDADPARLWEILAIEFDDVQNWASGVESSTRNAALVPAPGYVMSPGRVCQVAGFGELDERVIEADEAARRFTFEATAAKLPSFVRDIRNTMSVASTANAARVTSQINADAGGVVGSLAAPLMRRQFRRTIRTILADLKVYAETGRPAAAA